MLLLDEARSLSFGMQYVRPLMIGDMMTFLVLN